MALLNLTSNFDPGTYNPYLLDNLQMTLPFIAEGRLGYRLLLPEDLQNFCYGREVYVNPHGYLRIGQYNINTNGTKIIYRKLGKPYRAKVKNQNFFEISDYIDLEKQIGSPCFAAIGEDLFKFQIDLFGEFLSKTIKAVEEAGTYLRWNTTTLSSIRTFEICRDYTAGIESEELIKILNKVISKIEGEPRDSGEFKSARYQRKAPYHYWDVKIKSCFLKNSDAQIKLYQKGDFVRLELRCERIKFQEPVEDDCVHELVRQLQCIALEAKHFMRIVDKHFRSHDDRISDKDHATLKNVIASYLGDMTCEKNRIFFECMTAGEVYTPSRHRGKEIKRKMLKKISDPSSGFCEVISASGSLNSAKSYVLRKDWKRKYSQEANQDSSMKQGPSLEITEACYNRREFLLGVPIFNAWQKLRKKN